MTFTKICGVTCPADARSVAGLGAEFIGVLVCVPETHLSCDPIAAAAIVDAARPARVLTLTIERDPDALARLATTIRPWGIQLLRSDGLDISRIRRKVECKLVPVIHVHDRAAVDIAVELDDVADMILLDSCVERLLGGTGVVHDWTISREIVQRVKAPVCLAGGLNPRNVGRAIAVVRPDGVDAESALRSPDGRRDLEKVEQFIRAVQATASSSRPQRE